LIAVKLTSMKTEKITINKSAQQPAGVEIDIVIPDGKLEEQLIGFMISLYLRDLKHAGRINYELPDQFTVDYRGEGRYVASVVGGVGPYYEPPRPVCLVGLRVADGRFDLIHAPLAAPQAAAAPVAAAPPDAESPAPAGEAPAAQPQTPEPSTGES